ncbi:MAG TPA: hypothetical protein DCY59_11265 [Micrococcaceae bacterium]|nr:hypothetical protein [Micrococcaceae bacterium]
MSTMMLGQLSIFDLPSAPESGLKQLTFYYSWEDLHCSICGEQKRSVEFAVAGQVCLDYTVGLANIRSTAWVSCKICKDCDTRHPDELKNIGAELEDGSRPYGMGDKKPIAPLGFTSKEFHPDDFDAADAANRRWVNDKFKMYQGWVESITGRSGSGSYHPSFTYTADLRCTCNDARLVRDRLECYCVGGRLERVYCAGCDWWTAITDRETEASELLLDHCWPGWRDLPIIETKMKPNGGYTYKYPAGYPEAWKVRGAPTRDVREHYSSRHVPGYNEFGGYKTAVPRDTQPNLKVES